MKYPTMDLVNLAWKGGGYLIKVGGSNTPKDVSLAKHLWNILETLTGITYRL
jgi:hypothetical protein